MSEKNSGNTITGNNNLIGDNSNANINPTPPPSHFPQETHSEKSNNKYLLAFLILTGAFLLVVVISLSIKPTPELNTIFTISFLILMLVITLLSTKAFDNKYAFVFTLMILLSCITLAVHLASTDTVLSDIWTIAKTWLKKEK